MIPISVVVPMYRTAATATELHRRLSQVFEQLAEAEFIFIDDGCDAGSTDAIASLCASDPRVVPVHHSQNRGQQLAIQSGLRVARGDTVVVMDADLQDPPEAIPDLLTILHTSHFDAVFAGRRGHYEGPIRLLTGHCFKWLLSRSGHTPRDAGGYVAMSRPLVDDLLAQPGKTPYLLSNIAATRRPVTSIPVDREKRPMGRSATTSRARLRLALAALMIARGTAHATKPTTNHHQSHNAQQRAHFDVSSLSNKRMTPSNSTYVERHLDRVIAATGARKGQRILDVGCGQGKFSLPLIDRGYDVTGLDLSSDLLDALRHHLGGRSMVSHCGDLLDPPTPLHESFDVVVGFFMLHHVPDLSAAFAGVKRCLRPGGVAAFLEPNGYSPLFPIQITLTPSMTWSSDRGVLQMRRAKLNRSLLAAGLEPLTHQWTGLFPPAITNRFGARLEEVIDERRLLGPLSSFQVITARRPEGAPPAASGA